MCKRVFARPSHPVCLIKGYPCTSNRIPTCAIALPTRSRNDDQQNSICHKYTHEARGVRARARAFRTLDTKNPGDAFLPFPRFHADTAGGPARRFSLAHALARVKFPSFRSASHPFAFRRSFVFRKRTKEPRDRFTGGQWKKTTASSRVRDASLTIGVHDSSIAMVPMIARARDWIFRSILFPVSRITDHSYRRFPHRDP